MSSKEIFELRKSGKTEEALALARAQHAEHADDQWFQRAYGWALFDQIKKLVAENEANKLSIGALNTRLTPLMREFAHMASHLRGDLVFSQILRQAGKVAKVWHDFLKFARWAGIDDFSEEDKKPYVTDDGKKLDSLQKNFIRAICRETASHAALPDADPKLLDWGKDILNKALAQNPNDQWLNYYQSKLHLAQGKADDAIQSLIPILRRQPRAAWPWAQLGEILAPTRPQDALTCLAHATQLAREEQEVGRVRIHLAQLLTKAGRHDEAAEQTRLALQYRETNGYKVPAELQQLLDSNEYQQAVANNALQPLPKMQKAAQTLLEELDPRKLNYTTGVIDHINTAKSLSFVATGHNSGIPLSHRKFPKLAKLPPGTLVDIGQAEADGPAEDWRLSAAKALPDLCENFSGNLERHQGKDFAFINIGETRIFVPPELAADFSTDKHHPVTCIAIKRTDKQGRTGWRCVRLINVDDATRQSP